MNRCNIVPIILLYGIYPKDMKLSLYKNIVIHRTLSTVTQSYHISAYKKIMLNAKETKHEKLWITWFLLSEKIKKKKIRSYEK